MGVPMDFVSRYLDEVGRGSGPHRQDGRRGPRQPPCRCPDAGRPTVRSWRRGDAANASHAVNDFRKLCGIEAYTPVDNVSELTARINDDGWESSFTNWLRASRLRARTRCWSSRWEAATPSVASA